MKTKLLISAIAMAGAVTVASAQGTDDAIRYSNIVPTGTAKFVSMGGAMGAIGGDMTSVTVNPAGVSVYRNDQLTISSMWTTDKSTAKYYGTSSRTNSNSFRFSNVGLVSTFPVNDENLVSFHTGIVYNRLATFDGGYVAKGYNDRSSRLDKAVDDFNYDLWDGDPFFSDSLFVYDAGRKRFVNDYELAGVYGSEQRQSVTTDGSLSDYSFLLGANINNSWYVGGSLNIVRVNYHQVSKYTEIPDEDKNIALDNMTVTDEFWTLGGGVNLKLGVIGWLSENLRVGAAFHMPTIMSLNDDYGTKVDATVWYNETYDDGTSSSYTVPRYYSTTGSVDWELTMPAKFIGSVAIVAPEHGMIDFDCEVINYSAASIGDDDIQIGDGYEDVNNSISEIYHTTVNMRLGTELTFGPAVVRGGLGYYGSPYKSSHANSSAHQMVYSIGAGYRGHLAFIDMGYTMRTRNEKTWLYSYQESEASKKTRIGNFVLTAGFRF